MSPRGFGFTMVAGFVAWVISTLMFISLQPSKQNIGYMTLIVILVPLVVTLVAKRIFRNH